MNITPLLHKILSACSVSSIARDVQRSASGVVDKVDARANRQEKVEVVEVPIARQPVYRRVPFCIGNGDISTKLLHKRFNDAPVAIACSEMQCSPTGRVLFVDISPKTDEVA